VKIAIKTSLFAEWNMDVNAGQILLFKKRSRIKGWV
jgi:hypothetical protein